MPILSDSNATESLVQVECNLVRDSGTDSATLCLELEKTLPAVIGAICAELTQQHSRKIQRSCQSVRWCPSAGRAHSLDAEADPLEQQRLKKRRQLLQPHPATLVIKSNPPGDCNCHDRRTRARVAAQGKASGKSTGKTSRKSSNRQGRQSANTLRQ